MLRYSPQTTNIHLQRLHTNLAFWLMLGEPAFFIFSFTQIYFKWLKFVHLKCLFNLESAKVSRGFRLGFHSIFFPRSKHSNEILVKSGMLGNRRKGISWVLIPMRKTIGRSYSKLKFTIHYNQCLAKNQFEMQRIHIYIAFLTWYN